MRWCDGKKTLKVQVYFKMRWCDGKKTRFISRLLYSRTIMIGVGFLEGNLDVSKKLAAKVHLIEPVLEGTMQLFFQFVILYIIYGPGTTNVQSRQTSDVRYNSFSVY